MRGVGAGVFLLAGAAGYGGPCAAERAPGAGPAQAVDVAQAGQGTAGQAVEGAPSGSAPPASPPASPAQAFAAPPEPDDPACPRGMVLVEGEHIPSLGHACEEWINPKQDRCRRYRPPALKGGRPERKRFCVDRYEYPNLAGVVPVVMVDWFDAEEACEAEGKRLCLASEWTLACEGAEHLPYPYGYARDAAACNIDRPRPVPEPDFEAFSHPRQISDEVSRLDLRVASGERAACVSGFGARDMTGNVDEWVINEQHFEPLPPDKEEADRPYVSGLKGGYWGPIRARCRPMTTAHNEWFRFYQVGFRCCRAPLDGRAEGAPVPALPHRRPRLLGGASAGGPGGAG
jgi:hypothetical protein